MWKHLLVAVDFSTCAARATELGASLAATAAARITLAHVSPLPPNLPREAVVTPPGTTAPVRIDAYTTQSVRERLERLAAPLRERGLDVRTLAILAPDQDIADGLLRAVAETGADAIVVGTHGRKGLSHLFLGSVAERIVRGATIPVVSVRSPSPEPEPIQEERVAEDELSG